MSRDEYNKEIHRMRTVIGWLIQERSELIELVDKLQKGKRKILTMLPKEAWSTNNLVDTDEAKG